MKKIFLTIALNLMFWLVLFSPMVLTSCQETPKSVYVEGKQNERFSIDYQQMVDNRYYVTIFVDKNTGIKYMWVIDSQYTGRSGLTKLEPTYEELKSQH